MRAMGGRRSRTYLSFVSYGLPMTSRFVSPKRPPARGPFCFLGFQTRVPESSKKRLK